MFHFQFDFGGTRALAQYQSPDMDFKFGAGLSVDYVKPDGGCAAHQQSTHQQLEPFIYMFRLAATADVHERNESQSPVIRGA
jgi:hypothetical protein